MSETKFTSLPWVSAADIQQFDLAESWPILDGDGRRIATIRNADRQFDIKEEDIEDFEIEAHSIGLLMAAAPELLAACEAVLENMACLPIKQIQAAINKAKGQQ